jgi:hypothetical protein
VRRNEMKAISNWSSHVIIWILQWMAFLAYHHYYHQSITASPLSLHKITETLSMVQENWRKYFNIFILGLHICGKKNAMGSK